MRSSNQFDDGWIVPDLRHSYNNNVVFTGCINLYSSSAPNGNLSSSVGTAALEVMLQPEPSAIMQTSGRPLSR